MLGWAERKEIVVRNVARKEMEIAPKAVPSPVRALTADQVASFLAVAEGSEHYAFFVLAVATGMRRGEIGALTWEAIDAERGTAVVRQAVGEDRKGHSFIKSTKSGRERVVPPDGLATEALRHHRAVQREEKMRNRDRYIDQSLVFADEVGGMLDLDTISKEFSSLARAARIKTKGISLHSCRHFSATQALVAGNDVRTVAALLGHADPGVTRCAFTGTSSQVPRSGPLRASRTRSRRRRHAVRPVRIEGSRSHPGICTATEWQPRAAPGRSITRFKAAQTRMK
jgi:integrase